MATTAELIWGAILQGLPVSLALTTTALFFGAVAGVPICAAQLSKSKSLRISAAFVVIIVRSIPPIVWLFILFFGFGSLSINFSPFSAAALGLALITAANFSEIYRGALKAIPAGQWEACRTLGLSPVSTFFDVLVPQLTRIILPSVGAYAIGLLKDTAIASTIGVQDLAEGAHRISQQTFKGLEVFAVFGLVYFGVSLTIGIITRAVDNYLRRRISR
ncbi:amino acid ABC transporter permease [Pseudomonas sp. H11T01]|uniref:amino acid ABC transporter permease n=1 Tax=Pseudomonas sp. H11T01 TaxID=3402749 RepID=UPI003AC24D36